MEYKVGETITITTLEEYLTIIIDNYDVVECTYEIGGFINVHVSFEHLKHITKESFANINSFLQVQGINHRIEDEPWFKDYGLYMNKENFFDNGGRIVLRKKNLDFPLLCIVQK